MRHLRADYDAIQPFPTKRPHNVRIDGELVMDAGDENQMKALGRHMDPLIPDDEPVFLLRAQDPAAAHAVREWALEAERLGVDSDVLDSVWQWAGQMEAFAAAKAHGPATVPEGLLRFDGLLADHQAALAENEQLRELLRQVRERARISPDLTGIGSLIDRSGLSRGEIKESDVPEGLLR